jgi:folate/biopterin transporter
MAPFTRELASACFVTACPRLTSHIWHAPAEVPSSWRTSCKRSFGAHRVAVKCCRGAPSSGEDARHLGASQDVPEMPAMKGMPSRFVRDRLLNGFEPTPELGAILVVYFVQGALGISRLALSFFLKDELGLHPAEIASLTAISIIPWLIKPLYGFLSDALPLFGYRRRTYLVAAGMIGTSSWLWLAFAGHSVLEVAAASILSSLSVAISDVVADSLVVERVRGQPVARSGALQALCWGYSAIGGLGSAYFSGSLLEMFSARQIFAGTALMPLLVASLAGFIAERRVDQGGWGKFGTVARQHLTALWVAFRHRGVYLPVLFVFLWQSTPNSDAAMFFFNTNVLHFGPEFLGRVRLASAFAALGGLWLYQRFLKDTDIKKLMLGATLVGVPLGLTQLVLVTRANVALGISDQLFSLTDGAVLAALGQVAFMPTLVLSARLCPPGVEGTLFAALMSIYNASGATSNAVGGLLTNALGITDTDFSNLWKLVLMCSLSSLIPLPLLGFIDEAKAPIEGDSYEVLVDEFRDASLAGGSTEESHSDASAAAAATPSAAARKGSLSE